MEEVLHIVLSNDISCADDLCTVSQALAACVAEQCSTVTCTTVEQVSALLDSPRWSPKRQFAGLHVCDAEAWTVTSLLPSKPQWAGPLRVVLRPAAAVTAADIAALAALAPKCLKVQELRVATSPGRLQAGIAAAIAAALPCWLQLRALHLNWTSLRTDEVVSVVQGASSCQNLQYLGLANSSIRVGGVKALVAAAPEWPQMQHLGLTFTALDATAVGTLVTAAPDWPQLQHLSLFKCRIGLEGVRHLVSAAPHWPQLQHVNLGGVDVTSEGVRVLTQAAPHWTKLQVLSLESNQYATAA